ncbi:MAG TPA: NAD-dependent epimerase/dehydratase family protein [Verrucomicrobiae bacterium]
MNVLITGVCGFVGSSLARILKARHPEWKLSGIDNLSRPGAETNYRELLRLGVTFRHGDIRQPSDLESFGDIDWVIDAAANPSVLAGVDGKTSSRQLVEHNLTGTINLLEFCRSRKAGFILLSTSRVYSIPALVAIPLKSAEKAFEFDASHAAPAGVSAHGVNESFSTQAPVSLYGGTKLASEALALEYHHAFNVPVWVNRCGVLAGAGQFGHPAQGIFAYWLNAHKYRQALKYIGFGGTGHQVRDGLHPDDLAELLFQQMAAREDKLKPRLVNVAGGSANSMSLRQLTEWCDTRFGKHSVQADLQPRPFDIPWMVLDSRLAEQVWRWKPKRALPSVLEEIAQHAEANPGWLELSKV